MSLVEKALEKLHQSQAGAGQRHSATDSHRTIAATSDAVVAETRAPLTESARLAGARRVVAIDRDALRRKGLTPPESQEREVADQYRQIKRALIKQSANHEGAAQGKGRLVMLGSALPNDGKTFTCLNLALSLAVEKDYSVLLVDGDVSKPQITQLFNVDREPGLLDLLTDAQRSVDSVVLPTDVPRLSVLPAGRHSETAAELLASDRMSEIVRKLVARDTRCIVLFDSSPILLTSEARALATHVGQVVLVVAAGSTPQQALMDAIEMLGSTTTISLVLNQANLGGLTGYYYGHRYGYGTEPPGQPTP